MVSARPRGRMGDDGDRKKAQKGGYMCTYG